MLYLLAHAYCIIFDITGLDLYVLSQLRTALSLRHRIQQPAKIYLIAKADTYDDAKLPSDLNGLYGSIYQKGDDGVILFGDNDALMIHMTYDILEQLNYNCIKQINLPT